MQRGEQGQAYGVSAAVRPVGRPLHRRDMLLAACEARVRSWPLRCPRAPAPVQALLGPYALPFTIVSKGLEVRWAPAHGPGASWGSTVCARGGRLALGGVGGGGQYE